MQDKLVQARRKKEACRGMATDDNADCADLDKSNAQVIFGQFLTEGMRVYSYSKVPDFIHSIT